MLKRYVERPDQAAEKGFPNVACIAVIEDESSDELQLDLNTETPLEYPMVVGKEGLDMVTVCPDLPEGQRRQLRDILRRFPDVFTDRPGNTGLVTHKINLDTSEPIKIKGYPIPFNAREKIDEEVGKMLDLGVIEPLNSSYSSPVVLVRKKDGTNRFCIDFRQLNKVTVFDTEPMPDMEGLFSKLTGHQYISKLDLTKRYWQVPIAENVRVLTAFATPKGLYHFKVMPFGLVNAGASCVHLMRKLLKGMNNVDSFVDGILVHTHTWEEHVSLLVDLFDRLRKANLTARASKSSIAYFNLECLGHLVSGSGQLKPHPDKIGAIKDAPRPETKKQIRSFLGLIGFYRKFVPNFAAIASPLTNLTRKGQHKKVSCGSCQERAFNAPMGRLISAPILKLPDLNKSFILRTVASDSGLGAVLLQEQEGVTLPIAYASRKLLPREQNYSVIEKRSAWHWYGV